MDTDCDILSRVIDGIKVFSDGTTEPVSVEIITEHKMEIRLNGESYVTVACSPRDLKELAIGRLLTDGVIDGTDDIEDVSLTPAGDAVEVTAKRGFRQADKIESTGTDENDIYGLITRMQDDRDRLTAGDHCAYLRTRSGDIFCFEDIGRHNAIDKAVGWMLMKGEDPSGCMLLTSGRVASEIAMKAIMARIPVLVSVKQPTTEAVRLSGRYGLKLKVRAASDSFIEL